MHRDKKLGLALGILLIGIVGAFFFRNETDPLEGIPTLEDPESLDRQIAERPVAPYLMSPEFAEGKKAEAGDEPVAETPEFLLEGAAAGEERPGPPSPIVVSSKDMSAADATPVPEHNRAWTVKDAQAAKLTTPVDSAPLTHRIAPGETLSGLAQRYLGSSARFMDIYLANQDVLRSPNDLRVGLMLRIPVPGAAPSPSTGVSVQTVSTSTPATEKKEPSAPTDAAEPPAAGSANPPVPDQEKPRRFVPARRPFWPARATGDASSRIETAPATPVRSLTQVPPVSVPADGLAQ